MLRNRRTGPVLRFAMSHYDRYQAPCVQKPRCRSCGARETAAVIAGMQLCAGCASAALKLIDVRVPYSKDSSDA